MPAKDQFPAIFARLKQLLQPYAKNLVVTQDGPEGYSLDTQYSEKYGKPLFVGAVRIGKNYVSYHLMPVYMFPNLLIGISDKLKKRMQGKSCFNFTAIDDELFEELNRLTATGIELVRTAMVS